MTGPLLTNEALLQRAGIASDVYKALRDQGLPEQLCSDLTYDWLALREDEVEE